jgi:lipopolysaccharide export system permease protein
MKVLNRYIAIEVLKSALIALVLLLALAIFITFTDELGDLGRGNYDLTKIFQYLLLITPRMIFELMPSAALLGSLMALGAISNNFEIVAMRAAGTSLFQIIGAVMQAGLVLAVITTLVGEFVAPPAEQSAQLLKATAQKKQVALRTKYGFWLRDGNKYINIREMQENRELKDIYLYTLGGSHQLQVASHADKASYKGGKWELEGYSQSRFDEERVVAEVLPEMEWDSLVDPDILSIVSVKPDNLSLQGLVKYAQFLDENGQDSRVFELAFWSRLFNPLSTLMMLLIAVPFVLGFKRVSSTGQRVLVGILIGIGFSLFDRTFGHLGLVYNLNPLFAASFPMLLFLVPALIAIKRLK